MNSRPLHAMAACLALLGAALPALSAPDPMQVLRKADMMRGGVNATQIETEVVLLDAGGKPEKTRNYTVMVRDPLNSLILMRSPAEAGQKVLMAGEDYWLLMPSSQRPVRITPAQKLLGDASTGDIAALSWSESYAAEVKGEEACGPQSCLKMTLTPTRKGVSYQRIDLWVGARQSEPVKADFYLQSDKLAKRAVFTVDDPKAPKEVLSMQLRDELSAGKETVVRYASRKIRKVPDEWFNPMFLARGTSLE